MNCILLTRRSLMRFAGLTLLAMAVTPALGDDANERRLAIKGYDPVSYFLAGQPMKGSSEFEHVWNDIRWRFASAANRDRFRTDPDRYAPQYAGYCALGIVKGQKFEVDPTVWTIVDGKLYLNFNRQIRDDWRKDRLANIGKADEKWRAMRN